MRTQRLVVVWCGAVAAAGLAVYLLVVLVSGGAPPPAPPGLPDAGRVPAWLGGIASLVALVLTIVAVGLGLIAGELLGQARPSVRQPATLVAATWVSCTLVQLVLLTWELGDRANLFDTDRARALLLQLAATVAATAALALGRRTLSANAALTLSLLGMLPIVLAGHARSSDRPVLAGIAISAHVIGAALWIGGLAALGWLAATEGEWRDVLPRYSHLALVCVIVITASGVVAAIDRIGPADLLSSYYGAIITLKVVFLIGLVAAGRLQRRYVVERTPMRSKAFIAIAGFELTAMVLTIALAAALTRTPPPT